MLGKNNFYMNQKKSCRKFEKYSIKKLKVGAASVLVGAGFFLGFHVEASEVNEPATNEVVSASQKEQKEKVSEVPKKDVVNDEKINQKASSLDSKLVDEKAANVVLENPTDEKKATVGITHLTEKMTALQEQVNRIHSNEKQKSFIEKAEKLLEEAKALQISSTATQTEVDAKTKEISSLTSILKSIKVEETLKENKNQDSRNGKKMEEGTGFRTGVTDQALTGSIHFDSSKGPTEKRIPVANNGDGERVINMAITYSASSNDTVTDGKVRVTIPKAFLHSTKKPVFTNSTFVKSTDDRSTATDYVYDLNLNPMAGGSVAESLLKLYVGTSITNAPSEGDSLPVKTEFISGENVLSTKTATATFDYLSEIIYRENDKREKLVKNYLAQDQREYKLGSVVGGKLVPAKSTFRIPQIMTSEPFFNNREADEWNQNGNGRLTSYDYTISGIPEFLELDPNSPNNSKWTLENGVATLHPDQTRGIDNNLVYAGPVLKLKEGALSTPEEIAKVIESNGTKGYNAKIVYNAVGHRPDGSSFTQTLEDPDGFRIYAGDGVPSIGNMNDFIGTISGQRLFSNASNIDKFIARYNVPYNKLNADGATLPSQYLNYLIPKDQEGNYFTKFKMSEVATNELENGKAVVQRYSGGYKDLRGQFKENFQLYGVNENNQAELIKEYMNIDELFSEITINPDKRYNHLILKTPGIVDELQNREQASKTIIGLVTDLDVTVGTWKEKAKDPNIQRYEDKISQVLSAENTLESAVATQRPNKGASDPAVHTKEPTILRLSMDQIGNQNLSKDNLTRGQNIPITVSYEAPDYFYLAESDKNGVKVYDLDKLDANINKTSVMLLADSKLPLKDFRLTADNRLLSSTSIYYGGVNSEGGKWGYNYIKENYDTVNPTRIIENYKGTGKRAYIFESKDLGLSGYDLHRDGWIKGGTYKPAALTFEVENNGQIESGTYNIESYLVWNSDAETLFGNDRSLNANYVEGHEPGSTIAKANINVTMNNVIEYSTSLTISKPGTTGTRGIIDVKNGQEVILTPQIENLTDTPQKIKEAVVLIPKSEAVTYLEGPVVENSDEYDVVYTTSTATDKTTGTYVTADQITNWKDVTAVKYVFKNDYTVTKQHGFKHNFNLRVDADNQNFVQSTSQIFLKNNQNVWLESNIVGLRTEDVRGKLEVRYINNRKNDILPKISERDFAGQPYTTTKEDVIPRGHWSGLPYLFKEIQADSVPETGTYERQVTKKVTYVYEEATFKEESKTITRTINYLEKNNESNVVSNPVVQNITVTRKVYTGKETGRVVEGSWEYSTDAYQPNWPRTNSPRVANFEAPDREVIDKVLVSQELINNGNVVENVYYEKIIPVGGDVVAKYVIEGTTTELKQATDVAKGLKVGKNYTSTAPVAGEELTATDGKVYVYKGHKATSSAETGTVTADKQEVVYEYAPKLGGNVEVKYVIAGTEENLKDPVALVTNGQIGSDYTATKENTLTKDGLVYELVKTNNGLKEGSATETGKVTEAKQEVVYEYAPKVGGNVEVKYVIAGTETNLKDPVALVTDGQVGSDYTATKENTLTKDGLVYELVKTNNGLK
ncbi:MucBP domain-containing protein, partial [Granulicatella sp.]